MHSGKCSDDTQVPVILWTSWNFKKWKNYLWSVYICQLWIVNDILLHYFFISCGGQKKTVLLTGADTEYEKIKELIIDGEISASSFCEINKGNCGAQ